MRKSLPKGLPFSKTHQDSYTSHRMNLLKTKTTSALAKTTARNKEWKGKNANYLDGLPVLLEHIHSDHCLVELWIQGLNNLIVQVFLENNIFKQYEKPRSKKKYNLPSSSSSK